MKFKHLGSMPYQTAWDLQEQTREAILKHEDESTVFLVEHPPTYTLGRGDKGQNFRAATPWLRQNGFDIVETNRGGQVTYHGPGQWVLYPVVNLQELNLGIKDYVHGLETCMIDALQAMGVPAEVKPELIGAWVGAKKIGSIGIHVRKRVSIHGLALNIETNLLHFSYIAPCGLEGVQMTSVKDQGQKTSMAEAQEILLESFASAFDVKLSC